MCIKLNSWSSNHSSKSDPIIVFLIPVNGNIHPILQNKYLEVMFDSPFPIFSLPIHSCLCLYLLLCPSKLAQRLPVVFLPQLLHTMWPESVNLWIINLAYVLSLFNCPSQWRPVSLSAKFKILIGHLRSYVIRFLLSFSIFSSCFP